MLTRCRAILTIDVVQPSTPVVNEYWSNGLAQLDLNEAVATSTDLAENRCLLNPKSSRLIKTVTGKGPQLQYELD